MTQIKSSLVLLSGGLDSSANLAIACEQGLAKLALTIDYGQRAFENEKNAAVRLAQHYGVDHQMIEAKWVSSLGKSALTHSTERIPALSLHELDVESITKQSAEAVWVPNRNGLMIQIAAGIAESLELDQVLVGFNIIKLELQELLMS